MNKGQWDEEWKHSNTKPITANIPKVDLVLKTARLERLIQDLEKVFLEVCQLHPASEHESRLAEEFRTHILRERQACNLEDGDSTWPPKWHNGNY